jgi:hypothetical protein
MLGYTESLKCGVNTLAPTAVTPITASMPAISILAALNETHYGMLIAISEGGAYRPPTVGGRLFRPMSSSAPLPCGHFGALRS